MFQQYPIMNRCQASQVDRNVLKLKTCGDDVLIYQS